MPGQLVYNYEPPIGVHGQLIENYLHAAVSALACVEVIPVGVVVCYDTTAGRPPKAVRNVAATGDVTTLTGVMGITQWDPSYPEPPYRLGATLPVLRKGRIAIIAETALASHTTPFVRFALVGAGTMFGALRADADAGNAVAAPYLTVVQGAAIGGVAIVEIDL